MAKQSNMKWQPPMVQLIEAAKIVDNGQLRKRYLQVLALKFLTDSRTVFRANLSTMRLLCSFSEEFRCALTLTNSMVMTSM